MAGSFDIPESAPSGAPSPWAALRQLIGLGSSVVDAAPAADAPHRGVASPSRGALGLFAPVPRSGHAELFMSERTGDWIRVGCQCALGADHWHATKAD